MIKKYFEEDDLEQFEKYMNERAKVAPNSIDINKFKFDVDNAVMTFIERTNLTGIEVKHWPLIYDIAIIYYNRTGTEGLESENYGGVSTVYAQDLPPVITQRIARYKTLAMG